MKHYHSGVNRAAMMNHPDGARCDVTVHIYGSYPDFDLMFRDLCFYLSILFFTVKLILKIYAFLKE